VGIDHGGANILVAEQFLDGADIIAILQKMGGERVSEGVATDAFAKSRFLGALFHSALEGGFIEVVSALDTAARVERPFGSGEKVLPEEIARGVGVFSLKCMREVDFAAAFGQVLFVQEAGAFDLTLEVGGDGCGQGCHPVFFAFAIAHGDGFVFEIDILNAQANTLHETQTGTVEQLSHEFMHAVQVVEDTQHFLMRENRREAFGTFGAGEQDRFDLFVEHFTVEEEDGAESLIPLAPTARTVWVAVAT
jgi:hypothetical protein